MKKILVFLALAAYTLTAGAVELTKSSIIVDRKQPALVSKAASLLAGDIELVTGYRPAIAGKAAKNGISIIIKVDSSIVGGWERYAIHTDGNTLSIVGSDARGAAYGALHVSEKIGVSPWYWFADVPVIHKSGIDYTEDYVSNSPSVRYRGIFINDEDWGMYTWASRNFEKDLADIGPKTYDRICELVLRLKGNMIAPAMHDCTGPFYSHPESQKVASEYGIMITTSHCEPLLFNNASKLEWDRQADGEWNYQTNRNVILEKLDNRIRQTAQYDNIYTMGMRGLHDEAMRGPTDNTERARTLEKVFADQRSILTRYKVGKRKYAKVEEVPQIFVPYKETLDVYDAGLEVPEDITIVWPDDNYGYIKRVSNTEEQKRSGGSGVYYHLSYCGIPHDYLWLPSTPPVLMYRELMKAYNSGADRYWLLNVGDIKPLEFEIQTFMDLAWNIGTFNEKSVNTAQAEWFGRIFGQNYIPAFQDILDTYMQLAWQRKPEYMGYEYEWDSKERSRLHDTDFSFSQDGASALRRMAQYDRISTLCQNIQDRLPLEYQPVFFELLGYSVYSANQMNRKFLWAQDNHETGSMAAAAACRAANDSINSLLKKYNTILDGKWNQMMSEVTPGYTALYQNMPDLVTEPTDKYRQQPEEFHNRYSSKLELDAFNSALIKGIGTDWVVLPVDREMTATINTGNSETLELCISVVPVWPLYSGVSNRFSVSVDGGQQVICENIFKEWSKEWELQVLENRKEFTLKFYIDSTKPTHTITVAPIDPGQLIQEITFASGKSSE